MTEEAVLEVVDKLRQLRPEAIAVSLLFSYLNDEHERRIGDAVRAALPDTPVTLSSEIAREFREYPRTATTVINAALRPVVGGYLKSGADAIKEEGRWPRSWSCSPTAAACPPRGPTSSRTD